MLNQLLFNLGTSYATTSDLCSSKAFLSSTRLHELVSGNTLVGQTNRSKSVYVLYFSNNGTVSYQRKTKPKALYQGKWWIKNDYIYSQFPHYKKHSKAFKIHYYQVFENLFVDSSCTKEPYKYAPFIVLQGNPFDL